MAYYHLFVLFLTAVAATPRSQLTTDADEIQNVLQELLTPKISHQHVRNEHDHNLHHQYEDHNHEDHDRTNIETLNLIFKNNKIIPPGSLSKPIARTGWDRSGQSSDMMCKLGARCGCGGNAARCGCGRSGDGPCNMDHDHTYDDTIFLKPNPYYTKAETGKNRNSILNDKINRADPTTVKLLEDLENTLLIESYGNQNINELNPGADYDDHRDNNHDDDVKNPDGYIDASLKDQEKSLDDPEKNDDKNVAHLRCCRNCARKSYYRSSDDDKSYLRCCKKCGESKSFRSDDSYHRDKDEDRDRRDRSDTNVIDRAKMFQINDAIVLDVSDVNNVLKLLNNGNDFDNSNSLGDYVRAVNAELESKPKKSKYQNRLLPPTIQQKMKVRDMYRRSSKSGGGQYGVPFELDVQGLGQVNL